MASDTLKKARATSKAPLRSGLARKGTKKQGKVGGTVGALCKGLVASLVSTLLCIIVFALLIQWLSPSDGVISMLNQVLKLLAIGVGGWFAVGRGGESGLLRGAGVGLVYMLAGVLAYSLLSGLSLPWTAYAADLGMGVASGGLFGMIFSNLPEK